MSDPIASNNAFFDSRCHHVNRFCSTIFSKKILLVLLIAFRSISCWAADQSALENVSPKLKKFLTDHPIASSSLTQNFSHAFSNRKLNICYFYSDDESVARASHYYPDVASVTILLRENQLPCDECTCLLFEIINSEGEPRFQQLIEMAKAGKISRADYARECLRQEFDAVQKTRDLFMNFGLTQQEMSESYFYHRLIGCPPDFDEFLSYIVKVSPQRNQFKEYQKYYDSLNKATNAGEMPTHR